MTDSSTSEAPNWDCEGLHQVHIAAHIERAHTEARQKRLPRTDAAFKMDALLDQFRGATGLIDSNWRNMSSSEFSNLFMNDQDSERAERALEAMRAIAQNSTRFNSLLADLNQFAVLLMQNNLFNLPVDLEQIRCLNNESKIRVLSDGYHPQTELRPLETLRLSNSEEIMTAINRVVRDEESLWGDTILEGDYHLTSKAKPTNIEAVLRGELILGYHFTVQADAVMTGDGDCRYDEETHTWIGEDCSPGIIYSNRLIDLDLKDVETPHEPEFDH